MNFTKTRQLAPGQFIERAYEGPTVHWIGGTHAIEGAHCPNCEKPLMLHLTLNPIDPLLRLTAHGLDSISLLSCMRCALCFWDFSYRLISATEIELVEAFTGPRQWDDWYRYVGFDVIEKASITLVPMPVRLQYLSNKLNANVELTKQEEAEFASYINSYAEPAAGAYPIVDVTNQVMGRAFLGQRLEDPWCPYCKPLRLSRKRMFFLASLTNDKRQGFRFSYDAVQIVFFFCPRCCTINRTAPL